MLRGVMIIEGSPRGMAKQFRSIVKEELEKIIDEWHQNTLPLHFEKSAHRRYKKEYRPREVKYQKRKTREKPMAGPLEWSGESKRQLMQRIRISTTSKKATGTMFAPPYFWMKPRHCTHVNKGEELVAITKKEVLIMAKLLSERVAKRLDAIKDKEVIR